MYAKRIDNTNIICLTRPYLCENGRILTNPTDAQLRAAGYKPLLTRSEEKTPAAFTVYYEEDDANIYACYREEADI